MPQPTTNYQALGEYTAFKQAALSALDRRNTWAANLERDLRSVATQETIDTDKLRMRLDELETAQSDLSRALARANAAGNQCGQPLLNVVLLGR